MPKVHLRLLSDLPAGLAAEFLTTAQRLERAVEDGLGAAGSMILVNNVVSQSVPHLHMHVIPRNPKDGLRLWLGPRHPYDAEHPADEYAAKIRAAWRPSRSGLIIGLRVAVRFVFFMPISFARACRSVVAAYRNALSA